MLSVFSVRLCSSAYCANVAVCLVLLWGPLEALARLLERLDSPSTLVDKLSLLRALVMVWATHIHIHTHIHNHTRSHVQSHARTHKRCVGPCVCRNSTQLASGPIEMKKALL